MKNSYVLNFELYFTGEESNLRDFRFQFSGMSSAFSGREYEEVPFTSSYLSFNKWYSYYTKPVIAKELESVYSLIESFTTRLVFSLEEPYYETEQ